MVLLCRSIVIGAVLESLERPIDPAAAAFLEILDSLSAQPGVGGHRAFVAVVRDLRIIGVLHAGVDVAEGGGDAGVLLLLLLLKLLLLKLLLSKGVVWSLVHWSLGVG